MTWDRRTGTATVKVTDTNGALSASVNYAGNAFTNKYEKGSVTLKGDTALTVQKTFTGRESGWGENDKFGFTVEKVSFDNKTGKDDLAKMPDVSGVSIGKPADGGTVNTAALGGDDGVTFEQAGTYVYKVKETKGNLGGVTYDGHEATVTIVVSETAPDGTYDGNLQSLGYADLDDPSTISIYPKDFDCKALIVDALDAYNASAEANGEDDKVVRYTDVVGTLMTSVTKIINMISNMLVAFVSISLVVSSIMIGVITYISVLERRKEIGILRAIGASKRNISEVFNAETFIIGLCSGCMGVGLSLILLIPGNMLIHSIADSASVTAALPLQAALVLIALATLLTILGGLIPAKSASKCDPVKALRSE